MKPKIYFILHLENYRIGFITPESWEEDCKPFKNWFFSYQSYYVNIKTKIIQLFFLGLGFGYKRLIK